MSKRYPGNFITGNPVALSQTSNNGIWDLKDNYHATTSGTWQESDGIYEIGKSLRFRNSATAYLSKTFSTAGNKTAWTFSTWIKISDVSASNAGILMSAGSSGVNDTQLWISNGGSIDWMNRNSSSINTRRSSNQVFRDPSAWYHVLFVWDSYNTVPDNRARVYVNGVTITSWATNTLPSSGQVSNINDAVAHQIGAVSSASKYFDGYMTETNFIDGQALDPSYFGYTDSITGIWQPKSYTGSYGTNGYYLPFKSESPSYQALFNGTNQYLSIADNAAFDFGSGDFTVETWFYRTGGGGRTSQVVLNQSISGAASDSAFYFGAGSDGMSLYLSTTGSSWTNNIETSTAPPAGVWSHCVWQRRSNVLELYLNGIKQTPVSGSPSFTGTVYNSTRNVQIGTQEGSSLLTGYLSNLKVTKGRAVYQQNFVPISGPQVANSDTSLLTLQNATFVDNSANNFTITNTNTVTLGSGQPWISADCSGSGNHWTTANIIQTPGGVTYDIMVDSPINVFTTATDIGGVVPGNYSVMNPLTQEVSGVAIDGNLKLSNGAANNGNARSSIAYPSSGSWYTELTVGSTTNSNSAIGFGVILSSVSVSGGLSGYNTANEWGIYASNISYLNNSGSISSGGAVFSAGDVLQLAIDRTNNKTWIGKNNTWYDSSYGTTGNPSTGANPTFTSVTTNDVTLFAMAYANSANINFGQRAFAYTPPAGFKSLNTTNIQALGTTAVGSSAIQANKWFDISLFGGTSGDVNVTNAGFQPDFVWVKSRAQAQGHNLVDSVRGGGEILQSNSNALPLTATKPLLFNSSGFTSTIDIHTSGYQYVGWQWKQSPTSGFNIVTYTGTGSTQAITHNLGVAPKLIITKTRNSGGTYDWYVYHGSLANTEALYFNLNLSKATGSALWGSTTPTSSSFTVGSPTAGTNINGLTYVAYLWAEVPGFSKFGSYTGNNSTDGPFAYCGFKPKFVIFKRSDAASDWYIMDTSRNTYNTANTLLATDLNYGESSFATTNYVDFVSNGFKIRQDNTNGYINASGGTYIYAAFAESPFALNNRAR